MREIVYTEEVRHELAEAAAWHDEHGSLGSAQFVSAIHDEIERICEVPFASPPWSYAPKYRARRLRRLNYRIIYEVTDQEIRIVALVHTSRDPKHWAQRVK